jgi:hypothetical protein
MSELPNDVNRFSPQYEALQRSFYAWMREDAPLTVKMTITPMMMFKLLDRQTAELSGPDTAEMIRARLKSQA